MSNIINWLQFGKFTLPESIVYPNGLCWAISLVSVTYLFGGLSANNQADGQSIDRFAEDGGVSVGASGWMHTMFAHQQVVLGSCAKQRSISNAKEINFLYIWSGTIWK